MAMIFGGKGKKNDSRKYHHLTKEMPLELRHFKCPVCRENFTSEANRMTLKCPNKSCNMYYHDWGNGNTCWDAIDKCARPGCNGKDFEKQRIKKQKDKKSMLYLAGKIKSGQNVTTDEMALMAQLVREYPEVDISPDILKKIIHYIRYRKSAV